LTIWTILKLTRRDNFKLRHCDFPRQDGHATTWVAAPPPPPGVEGEGLLLAPLQTPLARVVALPDADQSPEALVGLAPGVPVEAQFARRLAENGCRVLVPTLIDR
jgi:hypothetical protein